MSKNSIPVNVYDVIIKALLPILSFSLKTKGTTIKMSNKLASPKKATDLKQIYPL